MYVTRQRAWPTFEAQRSRRSPLKQRRTPSDCFKCSRVSPKLGLASRRDATATTTESAGLAARSNSPAHDSLVAKQFVLAAIESAERFEPPSRGSRRCYERALPTHSCSS